MMPILILGCKYADLTRGLTCNVYIAHLLVEITFWVSIMLTYLTQRYLVSDNVVFLNSFAFSNLVQRNDIPNSSSVSFDISFVVLRCFLFLFTFEPRAL